MYYIKKTKQQTKAEHILGKDLEVYEKDKVECK